MNADSSLTPPPAHILIVNANKHGLAARRSVLEELGYTVSIAKGAEAALHAFVRKTFSLVITDYKMPDMNGVELIREIRREHPALPVILISGFADTLGLNENNTGANVVIQKSANEVAHLVRSVKRLLSAPKKPVRRQQSSLVAKRRGVQ